jgi:hypothetical protein
VLNIFLTVLFCNTFFSNLWSSSKIVVDCYFSSMEMSDFFLDISSIFLGRKIIVSSVFLGSGIIISSI